jgi:hypothetical protein
MLSAPNRRSTDRCEATPSWIAGLRHPGPDGTNRAKYCLGLRAGEQLDLVPEPENPYDQNAVAIKHKGWHLGYVPTRHDWVSKALEEGDQLSCAVVRMETAGWLFRRVSFVAISITVERDGEAKAAAAIPVRALVTRAREACIDGLRILAYMAKADDTVAPDEVKIEVSYIDARLAAVGMCLDVTLTDEMLAVSQGLVVSKRSLSRAVNIVAEDREHFKLAMQAVLNIYNLGGDPQGLHRDALERMQKAGKAKGWI